jgi:hypothetical protein
MDVRVAGQRRYAEILDDSKLQEVRERGFSLTL